MTTAGARLRILGGVDLRDASGREVRPVLTQPKRLVLLAYLALAGHDRFIRRDTLTALFWPESDQDAARHSLRSALHFLRQWLGEGVIQSRGHEDIAVSETELWCDAVAFQALMQENPADALRLYRGDLLEGVFVADASPELERWLDEERQRLRRTAAAAAFGLAEDAERDANAGLVRHWAARYLELARDDEAALRRLMAMLLRLGDRAGAIRLYDDLASWLAKELETEPSRETQHFASTIREPLPIPSPIEVGTDRPAEATAGTVPGISAHGIPSARRGVLLWAALGAVVLGAIATAIGLRRRAPDTPPVLAVGMIENRASPDSGNLAGVLRDLLATDLGRVQGLHVVSEARILELLGQMGVQEETPAARTEAARRAGARELLEGVLYQRSPTQLRLDLRRVNLATGVLQGSVSAEAADLFSLADSATTALGRSYRRETPTEPLVRVTTTSLVARRFYEEGLRAHYQGDHGLALRFFRSALAEDSTFAMAAYYAAVAAAWAEPLAAPEFMRQARRAAANQPERERLIITVGWARFANDPSMLAVAESLASRFPTEPDGEYGLGLALYWSGQPKPAIAHLQRAVTMDSFALSGGAGPCRACDALNTLVEAHAVLGDRRTAEATAREWVAREPQSARAWEALVSVLQRAGRSAEALGAKRRVVELLPGLTHGWEWLRIQLAIRAGDFDLADRLLASQLGVPGIPESETLWWMVISLRNQGRMAQALDRAAKYRRIQEQAGYPGARLPQAQVLFESGRFREAARLFEEIAREALRPTRADSLLGSFGFQARRGSWNLTHAGTASAAAGDTTRLVILTDSVEQLGARSAFGRDRQLHFYLRGLLANARRRPAEAEAMFRRAHVAMAAGFSRINLELGRLLIDRGRALEAASVLRTGLQVDLDASNYYVTHRELHRELGHAFRVAGIHDSAATHEKWGRPGS